MKYLTLKQIKDQLNIDQNFVDEDDFLNQLGDVAEEVVQLHVNSNLDDIIADNKGVLPKPLMQAMLLMCGNLYNNREMVSFSTKTLAIPYNFEYLLDFYKNYNN
jgi:hypothetical protein